MKFNGKLELGEIKIALPMMPEPVVLAGIKMEFESECTIGEIKDMISIVEDVPDVVGRMFQKVTALQKQFASELESASEAKTESED